MKLTSLVTPVLAAAAFAVGCGGPSKDDFVKEADAICKEADEDFKRLDEPQTLDELKTFADRAASLGDDVLDDLRELEVPGEVEEDFEKYTETVEDGLDKLREVEDAATLEQAVALVNGAEAKELQEEQDDLAKEIGFEDCGD